MFSATQSLLLLVTPAECEKKELAPSTKTQWKTFANSFAKRTNTKNNNWKRNGTVPPTKHLTDENIRRFLAGQWTKEYNKATVTSAKSYISWACKEAGLPPFIKENHHFYLKSMNYFNTLKKDPQWKGYLPNAATSLKPDEVRSIARSSIRDKKNRVVNKLLRDKVDL